VNAFGESLLVWTYQKSGPDVLSKEDALELDDEKVEQLLHVIEEALKGFLGNSEVLARADASG
jgi:hypothetical protein